ncbi:TetR/AcrR family transcriptional regulator [Mediterraneibacter agrestimuris]|uniref:TetR/AcrR family transcriptional regulator n=1 Tax=Mediterraneibacter agrestimuris TaxID=2941333 RepID=UPI00203E13C8|nr:TetR/AcrR family transcriptional regulator [Mediterraneibacter agrestimuris]
MAAPRKDNVRSLIIDSAEELLTQKPFSEISLSELSVQAGISKGTLYYHFKNKNEILFAITDRYLDTQWQELCEWTENADKDTSLHRLVKYILERDVSGVKLRLPLFYDAMIGNEEIRTHLVKRYKCFAELIAAKISERTNKVSGGYFAWLLLLMSDGLSIHQTIGNSHLDTDAFIRQTAEYIESFFPGEE